nr:aminopeptidase O-like [Lytechinus pictus]
MWNFDPGGMEATSNDLPLMSNIHDIRVRHYLLNLKVNFNDRVFTGSTTLFLEQPASSKMCTSSLQRQDDDLSHSYSSSEDVDEKMSSAKDVRSPSGPACQEPLESYNVLRTKSCSMSTCNFEEFGAGSVHVDSTEVTGFILPTVGLERNLIVSNEDSDEIDPANTCTSVNPKLMESMKILKDIASSESKSCHERPGKVLDSFTSLNEGIGCPSPCLRGQDANQTINTSPEQSSLHLSRCDDNDFALILDCCDIDIHAVEEIIIDEKKFGLNPINTMSSEQLVVENQDLPLENEREFSLDSEREPVKNSPCHGTAQNPLTENLCYTPNEYSVRRKRFLTCQSMQRISLEFKVEPWSLKVWKRGVKKPDDFPAAVCITYRTRPSGRSLTWAVDQDGRPCVFTQGAWINNRSLFPCQEPPGAMATWQAIIHAPEDCMVIMSGDEEGDVLQKKQGMVSTLHFTDMLQPSSIVSLAIGVWRCYNVPVPQDVDEWRSNQKHLFSLAERKVENEGKIRQERCNHDEWPCRIGCYNQPIIPSRIIAPPSLYEAAVKEFASYLPKCLYAVFSLLGPHPFSRLDLLILPRCFASLGLASPSLIFLSQTLLSGDGSFLSRLAHEISHSWFGILIGARDWTEEWLSEGFATFMEDPIHAITENWSWKEYKDYSNLKALLRYQALKGEIENTESELQILRPMTDGPGTSEGSDVGFVKNGLNPDKWFLQVHYLKGYFLLHHITRHLTMEKTLCFINHYVMHYHGNLVLSKDIFSLLFEEYPELKHRGITMETIYSEWLDKPGMPDELDPQIYQHDNTLVSSVLSEVERWKAYDKFHQKSKKKKKRRRMMSPLFQNNPALELTPDQLILLLEGILDVETMAKETLVDLDTTYCLKDQNAEVRHRWCELVIKHKLTKSYPDVCLFLKEEQAMGVFLYGEMMASEDVVQQELARECFKSVAMEIDRGCYRTVHEMVYGKPAERDDG